MGPANTQVCNTCTHTATLAVAISDKASDRSLIRHVSAYFQYFTTGKLLTGASCSPCESPLCAHLLLHLATPAMHRRSLKKMPYSSCQGMPAGVARACLAEVAGYAP